MTSGKLSSMKGLFVMDSMLKIFSPKESTGRRIFVHGKFLKSSDRDKGLIYIVDLFMEDLLKEFRQ